jgi:hypothetical protein
MKKKHCPFEQEVLENLKSGDLQPRLKEHIAGCPVCEEARLVHGWLNRFHQVSMEREKPRRKIPPVDADAVWDGAFSTSSPFPLPSRELVKKAMRPLIFPQLLTYFAAAAVFIFLLFSNIPVLDILFGAGSQTAVLIRTAVRELAAVIKAFSFILIPVVVGLMSLLFFMFVSDYIPRRRKS